jgi:hypothetical protein
MPRAYFDPQHLDALVEVFHEAKRLIERRGATHPVAMDAVARRILELAYTGMPRWLILAEIIPPMTSEDAGLPEASDMINLAKPEAG